MTYIDNILILASNLQAASKLAAEVLDLLQKLGFIINWEKFILSPLQILEYLGMIVDTILMELRLPQDKVVNIQKECSIVIAKTTITLRTLMRLIGKMTATIPAVLEAPLHYRFLQAHTNQLRNQGTCLDDITLTHLCKEDISWWIHQLPKANGKKLKNPIPKLTLETDASKTGWGATTGKIGISGKWSLVESHQHINLLELRAMGLALKTFCKHVTLPYSHKERQSSGSEIHQYKGRTSLSDSEQGSDPDMDLVQAKEFDNPSRVSTRKPERVGRCRVEKESRNERLEIGSSHFPTIATSQWLCIPTILPNGQMISEKSDSRQSVEASSYSPSVASSSMVSSTSGFIGGTPNTANTISNIASGSKGEHTSPPSSRQSAASQLDCVVQQLDAKGVSKDAAELIQASWRKGTQKSYATTWGKWCGWCDRRETDPVSAPVKCLLYFITEEFKNGKQYSTLNTYRSAISATHVGYSGTPASQHPLLCRLLQGIFNSRPPMPKNVTLWDVEIALKHAESNFPLEELSLKQISERTAMLLALANADRVSDLHSLDLKFRSYRYGGVSFIIPVLTKTRRSGPPREVFYAQLEENIKLCPVSSLRAYEKKTEGLRHPGNTSLFISVKKPHLPVSSQTLLRWIKNFLSEVGIDTNQFTAHSTRGVATSTALALQVSLPEIMKAANWKRQSTFTRYYCCPTVDNAFSKTVLTALKVSIYFKRYTVICAALLR